MKFFKKSLENLNLSAKFAIYLSLIILVFCFLTSSVLYQFLKDYVLNEARREAEILLTQIDALGSYVKEELRPSLFKLFRETNIKENFILEAMSTTHVRTRVMQRFQTKFKDYDYRRVSTNPINPEHLPNPLETELLERFKKNPNISRWEDVVDFRNEKYLVIAKPVIVEKECLVCHGKVKDAPSSLLKIYPRKGDFLWKEGEIMGVEVVYVPLRGALSEIKNITFIIFGFGIFTILFLLVTIEGLFWSIVVKPLKRLSIHFKQIISGNAPLSQQIKVERKDEIGELLSSFNQLSTYLHEAQEAIKTYANTLQTIFNSITDPLALVNIDCTIEMCNKAYQEWIETKKGPVFYYRCNPSSEEHKSYCPVKLLKKVIEEKNPVSEYVKDENECYYYVHFYPVFDDQGNIIKVVHYLEEITEKKKMEEQIALAEKLAAIGQLAAGIAHEINNPLGGIILCLNNIFYTQMNEETKTKHIELINEGLLRIQKIIKTLLEFSRNTELTLAKCDLKEILENVLNLTNYVLKEKGVKLITEIENQLPPIFVDKTKLEQVFINLILNSIDAMTNVYPKILTIKAAKKDNKILISITDTGTGIPENIRSKIFSPFFTTKPLGKGTGLGLFICKSVVEQHRGKIWFETSDKGTTFFIEFCIDELKKLYESQSLSS